MVRVVDRKAALFRRVSALRDVRYGVRTLLKPPAPLPGNGTGGEPKVMSHYIIHDHNDDGIDRQGFLKSLARADTRAFCVLKAGVLKSCSLSQLGRHGAGYLKGERSEEHTSELQSLTK